MEPLDASLRRVLDDHPEVVFALCFGSRVRGNAHRHSDVDVAVLFEDRPTATALGRLVGDLERAAGATVDLVDLAHIPPAVAHRVFREGIVLVDRDHPASTATRARLELEWLDFRPAHERLVKGVLRRLDDGR